MIHLIDYYNLYYMDGESFMLYFILYIYRL